MGDFRLGHPCPVCAFEESVEWDEAPSVQDLALARLDLADAVRAHASAEHRGVALTRTGRGTRSILEECR